MMKFIKGIIKLDSNISDPDYEIKIDSKMRTVIEWCDHCGVEITFGFSGNNDFLCEFRIVEDTKKLCKSRLTELKYILKKLFPKLELITQFEGAILR